MVFHTFQKVNGCVDDACKVPAVQLTVYFVRIQAVHSSKLTEINGRTLCALSGYPKFVLRTLFFSNQSIRLKWFHPLVGVSRATFANKRSEHAFSVSGTVAMRRSMSHAPSKQVCTPLKHWTIKPFQAYLTRHLINLVGLYMHMDTVKSTSDDASPVTVQKIAYCDAHCPAVTGGNENLNLSSVEAERLRQQSRIKMKQARKTLAMKRESVPLILIPTIPPDRVQQITSMVHFHKKTQFIQRLIAYWTLKRQHRNGVPLLRRLQSQGQMHQNRGIEGSPNASELNQQLKYWQCLRQVSPSARSFGLNFMK